MLIIAEGRLAHPVGAAEHLVNAAWLGPMVDAGFLHAGWVDTDGGVVFLVITAKSTAEATRWLADLPIVREREISFEVHPAKALRFR